MAEKPTLNSVGAVLVTANPKPNVRYNLERHSGQLEHMIVVDNHSRPETLHAIREFCNRPNCTLLQNEANYGIAQALNRGIEHARGLGLHFVALFDQDSTPESNLIDALLRTFTEAAKTRRVALVSAKHIKTETQQWMKPVFADDGGPLVAITSGSLIPISIFDACGTFEEDLIIDRVDEEFCLRVRTLGYTIVHCEDGLLWVTLGAPRPYRAFGRTLFHATHYSPARRYYITRNRLVIVRRYWRFYPRWCSWVISGLFKELLFMILAEDRRMEKLKNMALALRDATFNRLGMGVPL